MNNKNKEKTREPDRATQILAFPIVVLGCSIFSISTIATNFATLIFSTIFGTFFILIGFTMVWATNIDETK